LIKWLAAAVNPADLNIIEGTYGVKSDLPGVGGTEGVGQIIEKGIDVKLNTQDLVIPAKPLGTWRTYSVLKQDEVLHVPSDIPLGYLATLSSPCTALRLIEDFVTLERGDTILQNGSNSSVGTAVVQIAKAKGFETVNLLRDRRTTTDDGDYIQRTKKLKRIGGLAVFPENYLGTPKMKQLMNDIPQPKLGLNMIGGSSATEMIRNLRDGGTLVTYGGMSKRPVTVPTGAFIFNDINLRGFWLTRWLETHSIEERQKMLQTIYDLYRQQKLYQWLEVWKFDKWSDAFNRLKVPFKDRKLVLQMSEVQGTIQSDTDLK